MSNEVWREFELDALCLRCFRCKKSDHPGLRIDMHRRAFCEAPTFPHRCELLLRLPRFRDHAELVFQTVVTEYEIRLAAEFFEQLLRVRAPCDPLVDQ